MSRPWKLDSPIELEDGTLRCKEHNLEVCEKCCVDYTFMREILGHSSEEEEKQEEAEDKTNRCTVCGKRADKPCSKCKGVYYCSVEHQKKDWSSHRAGCYSTTDRSGGNPSVLWINLGGTPVFKGSTDSFQALIENQITVLQAYKEKTALKLLSTSRPAAVVITDTLNPQIYPDLTKALVSYVTIEGGTVILGFGFPNNTNGTTFENVFAQFGKSWKRGEYTEQNYVRNDMRVDQSTSPLEELRRRGGNPLPKSYSMKALSAQGLKQDEAIYLNPDLDSMSGSQEIQAPIAFTDVGKGWLGYLGDVNIEGMTKIVGKAMIGLPIPPTDTDIYETVQ